MVTTYTENPVRRIDMVQQAGDWFQTRGHPIWPASAHIYRGLASQVSGTIHVAGCGIGWGANVLRATVASDLESAHVRFARAFYDLNAVVWDITSGPFGQQTDVLVAIEVLEHIADQRRALEHLVASATHVWLSTPNRRNAALGHDRPRNDYHVRELTPDELVELLPSGTEAQFYHPVTFGPQTLDTEATPMVVRLWRSR